MINLEKKELEFIMTAVNNLPVQGIEGCNLAVRVYDKLTQIAQMKEPIVLDLLMPGVFDRFTKPVVEVPTNEPVKKPTKKATKK